MNLAHAIETYRGHTIPNLRSLARRNRWFAFSGVLIALSLIGLIFPESGPLHRLQRRHAALVSADGAGPRRCRSAARRSLDHEAEVQIVDGNDQLRPYGRAVGRGGAAQRRSARLPNRQASPAMRGERRGDGADVGRRDLPPGPDRSRGRARDDLAVHRASLRAEDGAGGDGGPPARCRDHRGHLRAVWAGRSTPEIR